MGTIVVVAPRTYVGQHALAQATATVTDGSGDPVEGARVTFEWQFDSGSVFDIEFTAPDGVAESWEDMGSEPLMEQMDIIGTTESGADSASDTTFVIPSPVIGYIRTVIPYYVPAQRTLVTASTLILDEDGVYDPSNFNDRLLLGLKGTMSEAELHMLRMRLQGGILLTCWMT